MAMATSQNQRLESDALRAPLSRGVMQLRINADRGCELKDEDP